MDHSAIKRDGKVSLFDSGDVLPCDMAALCLNSPAQVGESKARCWECRLAHNGGIKTLWSPTGPKLRHPVIEAEKEAKRRKRKANRDAARVGRNPATRNRLRSAALAERRTNQNIIKATVNSGRKNQDGDHISAGDITLDTKQQSKLVNPVVDVCELEKVREQARRNGRSVGGLVLRNQHGHGFVVFAEEDYAKIARRLVDG